MRDIKQLFIHCADTPNGSRKFTIRDVDCWHAARGFRRSEEAVQRYNSSLPYIGYHAVIDPDGHLWPGRGEDEPGVHATGHNADSLSVCLLGTDAYTKAAWDTLKAYVKDVVARYGPVRVRGHSEVNPGKTCPGFDVQAWLANGMRPDAAAVI